MVRITGMLFQVAYIFTTVVILLVVVVVVEAVLVLVCLV